MIKWNSQDEFISEIKVRLNIETLISVLQHNNERNTYDTFIEDTVLHVGNTGYSFKVIQIY
jgi:hypothetical protein